MDNSLLINEDDEKLLFLFTNQNNQEALSILFERYMKSAYYLALKYMHNQADAEDVVQKAFINIIRYAKNQNQQGKVKAWIMKIVINTSKNELQHKIINKKHLDNKISESSSEYNNDTVDSSELKKILLSALDELPEHFRMPIWLTHYENMSVKEIADCLGKPERTIRTHLSRGLQKLEDMLKNQFLQINIVVISEVLINCNKSDQVPVSLYDKVKSLSKFKDSAKITPALQKSTSTFKSLLLPLYCFIAVGVLSIPLYFILKSPEKNVGLENRESKNKKNELAINDFDRSIDFNSGIIPEWCSVVSEDKILYSDNDSHSKFLKSDISNKLVINLDIPKQSSPFQVSYEFFPRSVSNLTPNINSIAGNKKDLFTFSFKANLVENSWNRVKVIVQENIVSTWVNDKLLMVVISKAKYDEDYFIALRNMSLKFDNLKIQRLNNSEIPDFSKLLEVAKSKNMDNPGEEHIVSPIPEISKGNIRIYWGKGDEE